MRRMITQDIEERLGHSPELRGRTVKVRVTNDVDGLFAMRKLNDWRKEKKIKPTTEDDALVLEVMGQWGVEDQCFVNDSERVVSFMFVKSMSATDVALLLTGKVQLVELLPALVGVS